MNHSITDEQTRELQALEKWNIPIDLGTLKVSDPYVAEMIFNGVDREVSLLIIKKLLIGGAEIDGSNTLHIKCGDTTALPKVTAPVSYTWQ
jgi:hypothetical protein